MNLQPEKLVYELSSPGRIAVALPDCDVPTTPVPSGLLRDELALPELDELTVVRHFTRLSQKNYSIDTHFYPLGSCTMAGLGTLPLPSDAEGGVDLEALKAALSGEAGREIAGIMITNPNTLGLFDRNIEEIARLVHAAGGLVYGDGANMNALSGVFKPGEAGIDVMHFNLHKTFSTPHGGGGPGAGFVGVAAALVDFLPGPIAAKKGSKFTLTMPARSIGRMKSFYGNFGVLVRAYTYVRMLGASGLRRLAENAVLNANYLKVLVEKHYEVKYPRRCMHEFVASGQLAEGIHTLDVAKRLIDYGYHPPTIYFPLIVPEAIMIEPTETEDKETLDEFAAVLIKIAEEARTHPELLHDAPTTTPIGRLDEVGAARNPVLCYRA